MDKALDTRTATTRVFDFTVLEQTFREDPALALRTLADAVEQQGFRVRLLNIMPIAGRAHASHDTIRLTLDLDLQLVQVAPNGP